MYTYIHTYIHTHIHTYIRLKTLRRRLRQGREKRRRFRGPQRAVAKQAEVQAFRRGLAMRIWGMMVVEKSY